MEDGLHTAGQRGRDRGGGRCGGRRGRLRRRSRRSRADRQRDGQYRRRGRGGRSRGHGPDRPLDVEELFGDLAGEHAQLRDDVVFGRRRREERSGALAGGQVGHRGVDAVPFPELGDRPLEQEGVLRLPGRLFGGFPPGGKQQDVGAGQRHQAGGQQARQDGHRPPDILLRQGRERGDGDAARVPGRGRRDGGGQDGEDEKDGAKNGAHHVSTRKDAH